jgi:hypothetical protein
MGKIMKPLNLNWQEYSEKISGDYGVYFWLYKSFNCCPIYVGTAMCYGDRMAEHAKLFGRGLRTYFRPALRELFSSKPGHRALIEQWDRLSREKSLDGNPHIFGPANERSHDEQIIQEGTEYWDKDLLRLCLTWPESLDKTADRLKELESRIQYDLEDYFCHVAKRQINFTIPGTRSQIFGKREKSREVVAKFHLTHNFQGNTFDDSQAFFSSFDLQREEI